MTFHSRRLSRWAALLQRELHQILRNEVGGGWGRRQVYEIVKHEHEGNTHPVQGVKNGEEEEEEQEPEQKEGEEKEEEGGRGGGGGGGREKEIVEEEGHRVEEKVAEEEHRVEGETKEEEHRGGVLERELAPL